MHELMLGGHAAYLTDHLHLIAELVWFRHRVHGSEMTSRTIRDVRRGRLQAR